MSCSILLSLSIRAQTHAFNLLKVGGCNAAFRCFRQTVKHQNDRVSHLLLLSILLSRWAVVHNITCFYGLQTLDHRPLDHVYIYIYIHKAGSFRSPRPNICHGISAASIGVANVEFNQKPKMRSHFNFAKYRYVDSSEKPLHVRNPFKMHISITRFGV